MDVDRQVEVMKPDRFIDLPWQYADQAHGARIWTYDPILGGVIIATFNTSHAILDYQKKANARRAVACVNFCAGRTTQEIETMTRNGFTIVEATQSKQALAAAGKI